MSLSQFLDQIADHQRAANAQDAIGGNVPTWSTQTASVPVAVWPRNSSILRDLGRQDIIGTHTIVTDRDIGASAKDRMLIGGNYYIVNGVQKFSNAFVGGETLYQIDTTLRNQT